MKRFFILFIFIVFTFLNVSYAQDKVIKTNMMYGISTLTPNLGAEMRVSERWSIEVSGSYNPWTFSSNRKLKHWLVQSEARYWTREALNGHFFALHALGGQYNINKIRLPWNMGRELRHHRYEGWMAGAGIGYGYSWYLGKHWSLELEAGIGYLHLDYKKSRCNTCGILLKESTREYFGPTRLAINLVYRLGKNERQRRSVKMPYPVLPDTPLEKLKQEEIPEPEVENTDTLHKQPVEKPLPEETAAGGEALRLVLEFPVGKSAIYSEKAEFAGLDTLLARNIHIRNIHITGYASPEGDENLNNLLAGKRATALKKYLQEYDRRLASDSLYTLVVAGENWKGLEKMLEADGASRMGGNTMSWQHEALEIVRNQKGDNRKQSLKQCGGTEAYNYMVSRLYPVLRRTVCIIDYIIQ